MEIQFKVGMRVEAVLKKKEERGGYITDIAYFKPMSSEYLSK
jgi:uncharacterized OB-fold protein